MKLEEAIEAVINIRLMKSSVLLPESQDALELGIEALKEVREARLMNGHLPHTILPGETVKKE